MSELKSYDLVDIQDYRGEVYLKTEADKLIEELRRKLAGKGLPPAQPPAQHRWMTIANPPQNMREVLICVPIRGHLAVCLGHYNYSKKQWYLHDRYDPTEVAYWSEKPLPPDEEAKQDA